MEYYTSSNEFDNSPTFHFTDDWHWTIAGFSYDSIEDEYNINLLVGYEDENYTQSHTTSQPISSDEDAANAVMNEITVYASSAGPIHGGGLPKK